MSAPRRTKLPGLDTSSKGSSLGTTGNYPASPSANAPAFDRSRFTDTSSFAPSPSEAKESQRMNKRPSNAISPKTGPSEKRARLHGAPEPARPNKDSPTSSRQNSLPGGTFGISPASAPSRRPSAMEPSRDPRLNRRAAGSASPLPNIASPLSATVAEAAHVGSGNSTPVHAAPLAPSMVPHKRNSANEPVRGVASIRQAAAKKQMLPTTSSDTVALAQSYAREINQQNEMKKISERLQRVEAASSRKDPLTDEMALRDLKDGVVKRVRAEAVDIIEAELAKRIQQLVQAEVSAMKAEIESHVKQSIQSDTKSLQTQVTGLALAMGKPDPNKARIDSITKDVGTLREQSRLNKVSIDAVTKDFGTLREQSKSNGTSIDGLRKDINVANESINVLSKKNAASVKEIKTVKDTLTKQSTAVQTQLLDTKLKSLEEKLTSHIKATVDGSIQGLNENTVDLVRRATGIIEKGMANKEKNAQGRLAELRSSASADVDRLRSEFKDCQSSTSNDMSQLRNQLTALRSAHSAGLERSKTPVTHSPNSTSAKDIDIAPQLQRFKDDLSGELGDLQDKIKDLQDDTKEIGTEARNAIEKAEMVEKFINNAMEAMATELKTEYDSQFISIHQDIAKTQNDVKTLREQRSTGSHFTGSRQTPPNSSERDRSGGMSIAVRDESNSKITAVENQVKIMKIAIQSLTERYENISTNDLYQQMVHWTMQNYPNAPEFLNQLKVQQQLLTDFATKLNEIGAFVNSISWLSDFSGSLFDLAKSAKAIMQLVADVAALGPAETWVTFESIRADLAAEREARESLANGLRPLHGGFNSSIEDLSKRINHAESNLDVKVSELEASNADTLQRMDAAESAIEKHDDTLQTQRESIERLEIFQVQLMISGAEHQEVIKALNNNLVKRGGFEIDFTYDFKTTPNPPSENLAKFRASKPGHQ